MATIPQIRTRLLEGFSEKQADLLAHVVVEAHDDLVNQADFHALTGVVKELADAQKELAEAQKDLAEAQKRTEMRVEELADAQKRTELRVEDLAEAQKRTEVTVESLAETQRKMLIRLDKVDGRSLELQLARRLPAYVGRVFKKCRVIDAQELIESLVGRLADADEDDLRRADLVAKARLDGADVHLVVEVSCTADIDDVARVKRWVTAVAAAGLPAVGIVACEAIAMGTLERAERDGGRILIEGRILPTAACRTASGPTAPGRVPGRGWRPPPPRRSGRRGRRAARGRRAPRSSCLPGSTRGP